MTNIVHVKRIIGSVLLISILVNCNMWNDWFGREEIKVGGYVTLQAENPADGQSVRWIFAQLPDSSKLGGFLPSDTLDQVSFKPDVPGEYNVVLQLSINGEIEEVSYNYEALVAEDSSLVNTEIPDHLLGSVYGEDTTVSDTPAVSSMTDSGDQRNYLSKVIAPGQSKASSNRRSSTSRKTQGKIKPTKLSRGNLIPRATTTYTIQVSSWPSLEEAQVASQELLEKYGIDSYIQRAFFKDTDEIYYRLRIGSFKEQSAAAAYAKEIQSMTSLPVWVDYIRQEM